MSRLLQGFFRRNWFCVFFLVLGVGALALPLSGCKNNGYGGPQPPPETHPGDPDVGDDPVPEPDDDGGDGDGGDGGG